MIVSVSVVMCKSNDNEFMMFKGLLGVKGIENNKYISDVGG